MRSYVDYPSYNAVCCFLYVIMMQPKFLNKHNNYSGNLKCGRKIREPCKVIEMISVGNCYGRLMSYKLELNSYNSSKNRRIRGRCNEYMTVHCPYHVWPLLCSMVPRLLQSSSFSPFAPFAPCPPFLSIYTSC